MNKRLSEEEREELERRLYQAIESGEPDQIRIIGSAAKGQLSIGPWPSQTWVGSAARRNSVPLVQALLEIGFNVNDRDVKERNASTPLVNALSTGSFDVAKFLLERGADPDIGRTLIAAIKCDDKSLVVPLLKLLIEHGVNVNLSFDYLGDEKNRFTALDWAPSDEVAAILRAAGAKTREELDGKPDGPDAPRDELEAAFTSRFGKFEKRAFFEIVPSVPDLKVRVARSSDPYGPITLFTEGLSFRPMKTPKGAEKFRFAELFMQLPGDWPLESKSLKDLWPVLWLQKIAIHPRKTKSWLGGPLTILANEDPPQPLAPGLPFTCLMLLAEFEWERKDGKMIQAYRVVPLYTAERDYEKQHGAATLMRAFDRRGVPLVFDPKRASVVD